MIQDAANDDIRQPESTLKVRKNEGNAARRNRHREPIHLV
jgi:hypothetical protein